MAQDIHQNSENIARTMFWQGYKISDIADILKIAYGTIDSWKRRGKWDQASVVKKCEISVEARLVKLIAREGKDQKDLNEMESLIKILERTARITQFGKSGKISDINPNIKQRGKKIADSRAKNNQLDDEDIEKLRQDFIKRNFAYQAKWWRDLDKYKIRLLLKSRQIGATWYFAREAFLHACLTGDNQIFLSASKAQAFVFKAYIINWVKEICDKEMRGDPMKLLHNGAMIYFLSTNSATAQGYHGHVYMDEFFWIGKFSEFKKVASAMASHKKWRQNYFSAPSTKNHEAYGLWSGDDFNKGRKDGDKINIDISHKNLKDGKLCEDGKYRQIINVEDAVAAGNDLFDVAASRLEYNDQDFDNLYMCAFTDDFASFFKFDILQKCQIDSWDKWKDFNPFDDRPFGDKPVYIGYDPSRFIDTAGILVVAPPDQEYQNYRGLEKIKLRNTDFSTQAEYIENLCKKYNVVHIGIDKSSIGLGVFELVQKFFPMVHGITYNIENKNKLVLRAEQIISRRQLEIDHSWMDLIYAFLSIRKTITAGGRNTTFVAGRTAESGHADLAWAFMHAVSNENLTSKNDMLGKNDNGVYISSF